MNRVDFADFGWQLKFCMFFAPLERRYCQPEGQRNGGLVLPKILPFWRLWADAGVKRQAGVYGQSSGGIFFVANPGIFPSFRSFGFRP